MRPVLFSDYMGLPVDPVLEIKQIMHLPDLFPGILPVVEVSERNAKAALEQAAYQVVYLPAFRYFYALAAGTGML